MNHPSSTVRTPETQNLLNGLDIALQDWKSLNLNAVLDSTELRQLICDLDRARRQFDSKLFFVVVFGPLKAGKSTLTNALASDYVSPAGFGKETTRRPSLVISSKESAIDQYFSTDAEINHLLSQFRINKHALATPGKEDGVSKVPKVREAFDSVADYLRGIRTKEEFKGQIRVNTLPLTPSNLEETLTQDLTTEPLLTVIRCKGGHLLSHGVAVVDTPGLDGSRSNWRDDPIHEWVIKRAEFFIFVQSSVAAWNGETRDFVEEVLAQSTKPPIWLVQNIFEARHWQPTDKQRQAEADQREEGKKRIVELLGAAPRSVLGLNIGLAWDGKNELNNEWLQRSKFLKFEEDLAQILHAERASIQERNSIENLRQQLSKSKDRLYEAAQNLQKIRAIHRQFRDKLQSVQRLLNSVDYRSDWEDAFKGDVARIAEARAQHWTTTLDIEIDNLSKKHNRKRTGQQVNNDVALVASKLAIEGSTKHFAKDSILPTYLKSTTQYCKSAENDAIVHCNHLLADIQLPELPTAISPSPDDLPSMSTDDLEKDKMQENTWVFFSKKHEGGDILGHFTQVAEVWRQQIQTRKETWCKELLNEHFSTYCEKRRKHYHAYVSRLASNFEDKAKPEEAAIAATELSHKQIADSLALLEISLAKAMASIK